MKGGVRNYLMKDTLLHLASGLTTKNDEMASFSKDIEIRIIRCGKGQIIWYENGTHPYRCS